MIMVIVIIVMKIFEYLSIKDIRRIFNNEISLNTCLNQKKEYLLKEIGKKQRIIDLIEKNLSRKKAF